MSEGTFEVSGSFPVRLPSSLIGVISSEYPPPFNFSGMVSFFLERGARSGSRPAFHRLFLLLTSGDRHGGAFDLCVPYALLSRLRSVSGTDRN